MRWLYYLVIVGCPLPSMAEIDGLNNNWQQVKNENNIQVYTIDQPGTDIVKAKAVALIHAPLISIQQTLDDLDSRPEWIPFLVHSKIVSEQSANEKVEYSLFSAPWPASDRDFIYSVKRDELVDGELGSLDKRVYNMHSIEYAQIPPGGGIIRGEIFESVYRLVAVNKKLTRVEIIYHADPKGWLPGWIINIIQRAFPYQMMRNLKNKMEEVEP